MTCIFRAGTSDTFRINDNLKNMGTNCAPLVADQFLFCCERDFMLSLSEDNQSDVIEALFFFSVSG